MPDAPVVSTIGSVKVRLADWMEPSERYQRRYLPVDPEGGVISDEPGLHATSQVRLWVIRSWSGGEGEDLWARGARKYRKSDGVTLVDLGDGLQLARLVEATKDSGGVSDFLKGGRFGYGLGSLWVVESAGSNGYAWDRTNERWGAAVATGVTSAPTSVTDGDDTFMYSGHVNGAIWRWKAATTEEHFDTVVDPFAYPPLVRSWGGRLFALDGDNLYEIDKVTADTRTARVTPPGSSDDFLTTTPWSYNRMSLSDKGPIWLQRLDNGQTLIHEYNVEADSHDIIGKLAVDFAYPYSIYFTQGFVFIGFRYANDHTESGAAYLHFNRGSQKGVAGPFRAQSGVTASQPVLLAGQIGDDVIAYFDGYMWAYNLTDGGIRMIGEELGAGGPPEDAVTFGQDIFADPYTSDKVERHLADEYVSTGTLDSGRFDFDYPGLEKLLLNVGVITDPLPASTSVGMSVAVDGGAADVLEAGDLHETDGQQRYTWLASTPGADLTGYEFELQPVLNTSDPAATPEVRAIWATVTGVAHAIEWIIAVDVTKWSHQQIDELNGLRGSTTTFVDKFQNRGSDGGDAVVVTVEEVITPELWRRDTSERVHALVRMRGRDLVGVLGGS